MQDKVGMETFTKSIISPRRESAKLVPVSTLLFVNPGGGNVGGGGVNHQLELFIKCYYVKY